MTTPTTQPEARKPQGVDPVTKMLAITAINRMKTDPEWAEFWISLASSYLEDHDREVTKDNLGETLGGLFLQYARDTAPFMTLWKMFKAGVRKFSAKTDALKLQRS